jgi:hypothetical protein
LPGKAPITKLQDPQKSQVPTSNKAIVILSEAKDLWHCVSNSGIKSEMFRSAQHDMMATVVFVVQISPELGHGNLVIHNRVFDLDTS